MTPRELADASGKLHAKLHKQQPDRRELGPTSKEFWTTANNQDTLAIMCEATRWSNV